MNVINRLTNIHISSSKSITFLAITRLSGTLIKRTRFATGPLALRCIGVSLQSPLDAQVLFGRQELLACFVRAGHCTRSLQPRKDVFRAHFLYCLVMSWKRSWQISLPKCWILKSLNVEKILAVQDATYAFSQRKPDKNEKFRLAGIRTLISAIPMQSSNQYTHSKSERSVLALNIGPFRWVKYSPIFESNLAPLNQGQYSPIS